jgi:hypothetical protein
MFLEKLIVKLSNSTLLSLCNAKVHYRAHKSPPLDPILSQPNSVRPIDPYLPEVHFNVILPPTPRSSQWSLPFGPPNQNPGGGGIPIWRVVANILNKQSGTADKGWSSSLGVGRGANNPSPKNVACYEMFQSASKLDCQNIEDCHHEIPKAFIYRDVQK